MTRTGALTMFEQLFLSKSIVMYVEDRLWERSVEWSSHMYRRKIYQKELSIGESYRRLADLGLITRDCIDEETLAGSLVLSLISTLSLTPDFPRLYNNRSSIYVTIYMARTLFISR